MNRIVQLDFFRGLLLVVMTAHHYMSKTNILFRLTNETIGWVTAAEGFFFLSGFTAGIVYGRLYAVKGQQALLHTTKKRMATIYLHYLVVALLIAICVYRFDLITAYWRPAMPTLFENKTLAFLLTPLLLYLPPFFDILPSYLLFFTFLPLAIKSFNSGKAWLVLGLSALIYSVGFFYVATNHSYLTFKASHMPRLFTPFCWQFLFLLGIYAGHLYFTGTLQKLAWKKLPFFLAVMMTVCFFFLKTVNINTGINLAYWTDKEELGPLRLLNFVSITVCVGYLCSWHKSWFTFKPVCYLGKYSLEVFSLHVILIYFLRPVLSHLNTIWSIPVGSTSRILPLETILLIAVLLSLFIAPYLFLKRRFSVAGIKMALNHIISLKL